MRACPARLLIMAGACVTAGAQEAPRMTDPAGFPTRAVIEGVPRAGYDVHLCPFPGSLSAVLQFLGGPCDYDYVMGVSGAAFRRFWNRDDGGNVDLSYLEPEPFERILRALGYEFRTVPRSDKAAMVQAVKESVAEGRPVLATVLVGPPEYGIVTGYDQGGETLIGWSYFQDGSKPGYCEVPGWFEAMSPGPSVGLILIGERRAERPAEREVLISAVQWAIDLARTPKRPNHPDHVSGLAAYEAWADGLEVDADYPVDDPNVLETRKMVHCDQCVMLHERNSAGKFLRQAALALPEVADHVDAAAALYEEAAGLGGKLWRWGNWPDPRAQREFVQADSRHEMARNIRQARDKEAQAVEQLEQALADLGATPKPE
jgi:hypothetical protein